MLWAATNAAPGCLARALADASGTPYTKVSKRHLPTRQRYLRASLRRTQRRALAGAAPASIHAVERTWRVGPHDLPAFLDFQNVYRRTKITGYQYNRDFTARLAITEYMPPPSLGLRIAFAPPRP
ncbi:MAG: hypothetical protein IPL79_18695 [Myxococcales bacterium]|nr:hypothetical protein [Myxococcales bacterium]